MTSRKCRLALLLTLLAGTAPAHEFWLLPRFFVAPGTRQSIPVFVGENFTGTRWAGKSSRLTSFVHYAPHGTLDCTQAAKAADTLNTAVTLGPPGVHVLAFSTNNAFVELEGSKFNAYLRQEGLDAVLAQRQQRGELAKPGREAYRRCAKTLIQVGPAGSDTARTYACVAGHPLELVPDQDPYALKAGASLTVRVLADGLPLRGALVQVWQRGPGQPTAPPIKLHSNQNGRVLFRLSGASSYLVSAVRMVPAAAAKTADWQSTWATLTFGGAGISGH